MTILKQFALQAKVIIPLVAIGLLYGCTPSKINSATGLNKFSYNQQQSSTNSPAPVASPAPDVYMWNRINAIRSIPMDSAALNYVGLEITYLSSALEYVPEDVVRSVKKFGLIINNFGSFDARGQIIGTVPSLGCKSGRTTDTSFVYDWSCNCPDDIKGRTAGWIKVEAAETIAGSKCYKKTGK